jgi:hypothetical protein
MKFLRTFSLLLAIAGAVAGSTAALAAQEETKDSNKSTGQLVAATEKDAKWVAEQKAKYPVNICIVSDEKLDGPKIKPVDFIYRVQGKPDRLVTLCCEDCGGDFKKDPQKYLKVLDEAGKKPDDHAKQQGH